MRWQRSARLLSPKGEPLQARVGVATGLALTSQKEAIGEPSIIAAGVCDLAPPNSVVITASTRRLLSGAFACGNSERYVLAGMSKAVSACRVTGKRAIAGRFKAKHSNKITRLVGRDQELHQLLALWERAKCGEGQVALVCGEAGIGKSHLCEFLLGESAKSRTQPSDINVLLIISIALFFRSSVSLSMRWALSRRIPQSSN